VVWVDGHSDYGHAFEVFWERYGRDVGPKSTVLLLGDARNNYHASQAWVVKEIGNKARHVYWLNPTALVLEHRRLDRERLRPSLRRCVRVSQPAPARSLRGEAGLTAATALVVGRFFGDRHIMGMALGAPGRRERA